MEKKTVQDKPFRVPVAEICRTILWAIDKMHREGDADENNWIPIYDIQKKSGVSYQTIKTFVSRYRGNGLKVRTAITDYKKIRDVRPTKIFEDYLRDTFRPYD